jgi:hypothetical protein
MMQRKIFLVPANIECKKASYPTLLRNLVYDDACKLTVYKDNYARKVRFA